MSSPRFKLDTKDFKSIIRTMAIIYSPVLLLFLDQIQNGELDYKILIALVISTTIDILRRFIKDYTKPIS